MKSKNLMIVILLSILMFSTCSFQVSQEILSLSFVDETLKKEVIKNAEMGYFKYIHNFVFFTANDMNIRYLDGIEKLTALEMINLSRNLISDLTPLQNLTKLASIELRSNQISDLKPLEIYLICLY